MAPFVHLPWHFPERVWTQLSEFARAAAQKAVEAKESSAAKNGHNSTAGLDPVYAAVMKFAPAQFSALPGKSNLFISKGNGGRPVAVYIPEHFDVSQPATLVTYFAGKGFNLASSSKRSGLVERLKSEAPKQNAVWIMPQGHLLKANDLWMSSAEGESFSALQKDAMTSIVGTLGEPPSVSTRVVAAHSGGGSALQNAISAKDFYADKLLLLDCFYETRGNKWWQTIARWAQARPHTKVSYFHSTNDPNRVKEFENTLRPSLGSYLVVAPSPTWHGTQPTFHLTANP